MTTQTHDTDEDTRSVETVWVETLGRELPIDDADPSSYVTFLFGNPVFVAGDVGPDTAVVLVDDLLERYPPTEFFDVEGALSAEEWAALKEELVVTAAEGIDGERRGPMSAFPAGPGGGTESGETEAAEPAGPETPDTPGADSSDPGLGAGLADEGSDRARLTELFGPVDSGDPDEYEAGDSDDVNHGADDPGNGGIDLSDLTMAELYDIVSAVVAATDLDDDAVRRALRRVLDDLDDGDGED